MINRHHPEDNDMSQKIPTDGRKFAEWIGAKEKPRHGLGRRFAEQVGAKPRAATAEAKKFIESLKDKKK